MTGTGTKGDPYIVSTWEEFKNVIGRDSNTYVECVKNLIFDMNELAPEGIKTTINMTSKINGNGLIIRNLVSDLNSVNSSIFNTADGTNDGNIPVIENINFENIYLTDDASLFNQNNDGCVFNNCIFSGYLARRSSIFRSVDGDRDYYINNSVVSVEMFPEHPTISDRANCHFDNCVFYLNGSSEARYLIGSQYDGDRSQAFPSTMKHCRIEGVLPAPLIFSTGESRFNVITLTIPKSVTDKDYIIISSERTGLWVINKDLADDVDGLIPPDGYGYVKGTLVTTEQLKDPSYLRSVGFPIPLSTT